MHIIHSLLILANIFGLIDAFRSIYMSSATDHYLGSLSIKPNPMLPAKFKKVIGLPENVRETQEDAIEIDTILFNIYKVENIFFNKKSTTIMLKLKDEMKDIYISKNDDENMLKLANHTKIVSKAFKNFVVYPLDIDADAIMYKSEST